MDPNSMNCSEPPVKSFKDLELSDVNQIPTEREGTTLSSVSEEGKEPGRCDL